MMPGSIPKDKYININTIGADIDKCVVDFFGRYNIDIYDISAIRSIPHNTVNLCFRYIYNNLFKPDTTLCNNQKSLIDYENIELLTLLANKFLDICMMFNKSLGLMSFSYMTGINYRTLYDWINQGEKLNPSRFQVLKSIQEGHKAAQVSLLNDSPVGALAVANNDVETGLQWATKQAIAAGQQAVFLIPSERLNRLSISAAEAVPLPVSEEAEKEPKS